MEQSPCSLQGREEPDLNLREWVIKGRLSQENIRSRRFSGSYIRSFREETMSFRSNITISSTASSPGYPLTDEIDPSTYSFTTALKALQAKAGYDSWGCLSPDGFALNSKWTEAEKYICNPLSGEVPVECLSAKTRSLSGRSFHSLTNRIPMSAPLIYSTHYRYVQPKPSFIIEEDTIHQSSVPETEMEGMTKDVGTQSTPLEFSSRSPSPASTPPITERSIKRCGQEGSDSPNSNSMIKSEKEVVVKETMEEEKGKEREKEDRNRGNEQIWSEGGCFSWMRKRLREKHKQRKKRFIIISHIKGYI